MMLIEKSCTHRPFRRCDHPAPQAAPAAGPGLGQGAPRLVSPRPDVCYADMSQADRGRSGQGRFGRLAAPPRLWVKRRAAGAPAAPRPPLSAWPAGVGQTGCGSRAVAGGRPQRPLRPGRRRLSNQPSAKARRPP